jgi:hypothetical protein
MKRRTRTRTQGTPELPQAIVHGPPKKRRRRPLPEVHHGATVSRGRSLGQRALDRLVDRAERGWSPADLELYVVVPDVSLADESCEIRAFRKFDDGLRFAQAMSHGNVDHRVLRVVAQTLVVATENDLDAGGEVSRG